MSAPVRGAVAAWLILALSGCTVPTVSAPDDGGPVEDVSQDEDGRAPSTAPECEPGDEAGVCPSGQRCEVNLRRCVECVWEQTRCGEDGVREVCPPPSVGEQGALEGGFFADAPCPGLEVCLGDGECVPKICDPGQATCTDPITAKTCDPTGTAWLEEPCFDGQACFEGACELIRHNVLLVFDTSGSMFTYVDHEGTPDSCAVTGLPCIAPHPQCDDPDDPLTMITLAKQVFSETIQEAIGGFSQFALQRFPQREAGTNTPNCLSGWYLPTDEVTGDDGSHVTEDGGWFDQHRSEVLVVPFPSRSTVDNSSQILAWTNHSETLGPTDIPCTSDIQCDGGACGQVNGEGRCFVHDDPELRVGGGTPLGKSLFYAGEYLRRSVAVDGKPCETSEDCGSVGYVCHEEACWDPYASCREHFIILFTDGAESQHVSTGEFFNPVVQAKRLAYGLGCETDEDCLGSAACVTGVCEVPDADSFVVPSFVDPMGADNLRRPNGSPLRVQVSVVTLQPEQGDSSLLTQNERIALVGGGTALNVAAEDPQSIADALLEVMTPAYKCAPESPDEEPRSSTADGGGGT